MTIAHMVVAFLRRSQILHLFLPLLTVEFGAFFGARTQTKDAGPEPQAYKMEWRSMEGIHLHIAIQLSLIGITQNHGSKL